MEVKINGIALMGKNVEISNTASMTVYILSYVLESEYSLEIRNQSAKQTKNHIKSKGGSFMAKFCKYCGKQIDGGKCDCPKALAEAEERAKAQVLAAMEQASAQRGQAIPGAGGRPAPQPQGSYGQPVPQPYDQARQQSYTQPNSAPARPGVDTEALAADLKQLVLGLLKTPAAAMEQAAQSANKLPQYLIAAVFAVLMLLGLCIGGKNDYIEGSKMFMVSLIATLAAVLLRAAYGAGVYAMSKKYNPVLTFSAALALFSTTFIFDTLILLLLMIFTVINLYELTFAVLLFWLAASVITACLATWVLTGRRMEAVVRINLILQFVTMIILVFVCRGAAVQAAKMAARSVMGSFGF